MRVRAQGFWLPKKGSTEAEYEDALEPVTLDPADCARARFAVADGATETSWSGVWARILVRSWGTGLLGEASFAADLAQPRHQWLGALSEKPIPWYAEEKVRQGAFAAFAGLTLEEHGQWSALALGDSCLFVVRADSLVHAFPIAESAGFGSRPRLLCSRDTHDAGLEDRLDRAGSQWEPGDDFHLMTDALAAWFLSRFEQGGRPWRVLNEFRTADQAQDFAEWIAFLRAHDQLRNDDVTWLAVNAR